MAKGYQVARRSTSVIRNSLMGHLYNVPRGTNPPGGFFKANPEDFPRLSDRLPQHYLDFHQEWKKGPREWIHDRPLHQTKYEKNEFGEVVPVENCRVPVLYPNEFHQGLWGGEGVVKGLLERPPTRHKPNYKTPKPTYWFPKLFVGVVYSEVLDKHIKVTMTNRAVRLINEAYGLDNYLLKSPVNEIYSHLGLKLKREILLTLARKGDGGGGSKFDKVYEKYRKYVVEEEVASWHGLPWNEAVHRLFFIDRNIEEEEVRPRKEELRRELNELLKQGYLEDLDPVMLYEGEKPNRLKSALNSIKRLGK